MRPVYVKGVPEGIAFETLNELCLRHYAEPLVHVSHAHLSAWKAAGSYRLLLKTARGHHWRLIYKNAIYRLDHIPALAELPIIPGPPEYVVYGNARGAFADYLPIVYLCKEVIPGKQYQYLLEDLNERYRRAYDPKAILSAAAKLPMIHRAMSDWSVVVGHDQLLRYGLEFSVALQEYSWRNLGRYIQQTADTAISEIYELWPHISEIHARREFQEFPIAHPIHGDFNIANFLTHRKNPDDIKLVDWEWAGLGMAHADLASLLKRATPEIEQQALAIFCERDKGLSLNEHRRLYEWCQLERGLLDAAFLAAQWMESSAPSTGFDISNYIEDSLRRVLRAYQELA